MSTFKFTAQRLSIFLLFLIAISASYKSTNILVPYITSSRFVIESEIMSRILPLIASTLLAIVFLTTVEFADSRNFKRIRRTFFKGLIIWTTVYFISIPAFMLTLYLVSKTGIAPIIKLSKLNLYGFEFFIYFAFIDFFYYWFHRAQHKYQFLWRFHSFHHSLQDLNAANSYHHWSEEFFRIFLFSIPIAILIQPGGGSLFLISAFLASWSYYIHCDIKRAALPSWFRYFFVDNVYHHIHHGVDLQYRDKNFAAYNPIWDFVFGTQYMPKDNNLPITGVPGYKEPSILEFFGIQVPTTSNRATESSMSDKL
jgi:sterol desaturase/sphingolipid hydroxylase (fatty acid hydroxylase superfamily)